MTAEMILLSDRLADAERRIKELLEALRTLDRQMSGNETYEHAWVNYPTKPEESPASLVRKAISENDTMEQPPGQRHSDTPPTI